MEPAMSSTFDTPKPQSRSPGAAITWGRVAFLSYFRPPGLPGIIDIDPASATVRCHRLRFLGTTRGACGAERKPTDAAVDTTNNPTHGYDFFRFPTGANPAQLGGMPFDQDHSHGDGKRSRPTI